MFGFSEDYKVVGSARITYFDDYEYRIDNSLKGEVFEVVFYLYMLDKVLADVADKETAITVMGNIAMYMTKSYDNNISNEFAHFTEVRKPQSEYSCYIKEEIRCKNKSGGQHLYIDTSYKPMFMSDFTSKRVSFLTLYIMDLHDRVESEVKYKMKEYHRKLTRYYERNCFPSSSTLTEGPSTIVKDSIPLIRSVEVNT